LRYVCAHAYVSAYFCAYVCASAVAPDRAQVSRYAALPPLLQVLLVVVLRGIPRAGRLHLCGDGLPKALLHLLPTP